MTTSPDDHDVTPFDGFDGDAVVVSAAGVGPDRRAALRPASVARATPAQHDVLHELQALALEIAERQETLRVIAREARALGVSWGVIGWCVGLTSEGARLKYGTDAPPPRSSKRRRRS